MIILVLICHFVGNSDVSPRDLQNSFDDVADIVEIPPGGSPPGSPGRVNNPIVVDSQDIHADLSPEPFADSDLNCNEVVDHDVSFSSLIDGSARWGQRLGDISPVGVWDFRHRLDSEEVVPVGSMPSVDFVSPRRAAVKRSVSAALEPGVALAADLLNPHGVTGDASSRARMILFTWNNYPADWQEVVQKVAGHSSVSWIGAAKEVGEVCKTPHIQGVIKCNQPLSFNVIHKIVAPNSWWLMRASGTWVENWRYINKGEGRFQLVYLNFLIEVSFRRFYEEVRLFSW